MNNVWDTWKKPFTNAQLRECIAHSGFSQRKIAELSGRSLGTVNKVSQQIRGLREEIVSYAATIEEQAKDSGLVVPERPIGTIPDDYYEKMLALHEEGAKVSGIIARLFFKAVHHQVNQAKSATNPAQEVLKVFKDNSLAAERWMTILERSIAMEREASGVQIWQDINMAIKVIKDAGGDVALPESLNHLVATALKQHVEGM